MPAKSLTQGKKPVKVNPDLRSRALQCLARREYSRAELREKLSAHAGKDCDSNQSQNLDSLLDDLAERGWLSDDRAVTQLLHARRSRFGLRRIIHELHHKGISEELINDALPELKESEMETAREVWQKKFGALPHDARERARQMRFMQARGFSLDMIFQVLRHSEADDGERGMDS